MKEIILGGSGGQGVLTAGTLIAEMAIYKGLNATWSPEYGSAMRGGTASCVVKFGEDRIFCTEKEEADILLAMNEETLTKFAHMIKENGVVIYNSDLVKMPDDFRDDVKKIPLPCITLAEEIKHKKGANIIMSGAIIRETGAFSLAEATNGMNEVFQKKGKERFKELNTKALEIGYNYKM